MRASLSVGVSSVVRKPAGNGLHSPRELRSVQPTSMSIAGQVFGAGILLGSLGLKVPQLSCIIRERSTIGLSPASQYFDALGATLMCLYHFLKHYPLLAYGEFVSGAVQNAAVVLAMWVFGSHSMLEKSALSGLYTAVCAGALALPVDAQPLLILMCQPLVVLVSVPQILLNQQQGHTGTMSVTTAALKFVGSVIRVCTTLTEIGLDKALLLNYSLNAIFNATLMVQWWLMREKTAAVLASEKKAA
ncbi:unnamed protein product [Chrysoparadoxa australica]